MAAVSIAGCAGSDRGRADLTSDLGGLVLRGVVLEQGLAHLRDRRRLGDEHPSEIAPAGEGAELMDLSNVAERGAPLLSSNTVEVDHLRGRLRLRVGRASCRGHRRLRRGRWCWLCLRDGGRRACITGGGIAGAGLGYRDRWNSGSSAPGLRERVLLGSDISSS